ncbi:MAG: PDZ domain-containing protein, partial [Pseudomonadota bacterium]
RNMAEPRMNILSPAQGKKLLNAGKNPEIKNEGNLFTIKKRLRDKVLDDLPTILSQARAVQISNPDGSLAFKMTEIVPGSIYSQLSIQEGDIVTGINGKKITNLNEMMSLFGKIKEYDNVQLSLLRNGEEQNLEYNFE